MTKLEEILKPIDAAPKNGTLIIARFRQWNASRNPIDGSATSYEWQPVWWMPDSKGKNPRWKRYGTLDSPAFAEAWVTPEEFAELAEMEYVQPPRKPEVEFDL